VVNASLELVPMRLERLPGIHHDSSCILISGTKSTVIVDSGTSWYQSNLVERILPHLEGRAPVEAIFLSHRHFDSCGAAPHLAEQFGATIRIHEDAVAPLSGGDLFTTWASRYDSDMPPMETEGFSDGEQIDLGDVSLHILHTPGHTMDSCCFHIPQKDAIICGDLIPAAGHPSRADMPTGNLIEMKSSLERLLDLSPKLLVCGRGEAISGLDTCQKVINKHIESVSIRIGNDGELPKDWPKPAMTCHWLTPEPAWSFD